MPRNQALVVVGTMMQFHPTCEKLEPEFKKEWSKNMKDIKKHKTASEMLAELLEKAKKANIEAGFAELQVKTGPKRNFAGEKTEEKVASEAEKSKNDDQLPVSAAEEKCLENLNNKKKKKTKKETKQKTNRDLEKSRVSQNLPLEDQKELEQVKSEVTQIKKELELNLQEKEQIRRKVKFLQQKKVSS